jgi:hypothetical protein
MGAGQGKQRRVNTSFSLGGVEKERMWALRVLALWYSDSRDYVPEAKADRDLFEIGLLKVSDDDEAHVAITEAGENFLIEVTSGIYDSKPGPSHDAVLRELVATAPLRSLFLCYQLAEGHAGNIEEAEIDELTGSNWLDSGDRGVRLTPEAWTYIEKMIEGRTLIHPAPEKLAF